MKTIARLAISSLGVLACSRGMSMRAVMRLSRENP